MNFCLCTNELNAVKMEREDRRWFVTRTSSAHKNDHQHFAPLVRDVEDPFVVRLFYRFLVTRDLAGFNPRVIPESWEKLAMQVGSRPPVAHWLQHCVDYPPMGMLVYGIRDSTFNLGTTFAFEKFSEWSREQATYLKAKTQGDMVRDMKALGFPAPRVKYTKHEGPGGKSEWAFPELTLAMIKQILVAAKAWDTDAVALPDEEVNQGTLPCCWVLL
jgi:hypothetical protein